MLNEILLEFKEFSELTYGIIAGSIISRKKFWTLLIGIFTGMFGLYRLWIFIQALKDPRFRRFLLQIFTSIMVFLSIITVIIVFVSCSTQNSYLRKDFNVTNANLLDNYERIDLFNMSDDVVNNEPKSNDLVTNDIINLGVRLKRAKKNFVQQKRLKKIVTNINNGTIKNEVITKKDNRSKFINFRGDIIACSKNKNFNILTNRKIGKLCKNYYSFLKANSNELELKAIFSNLELNDCEQFGWSIKFVIKQKFSHASNKWNDISHWSSKLLPLKNGLSVNRDHAISEITDLISTFRKNLLIYNSCKDNKVSDYINNLYFGIIPGKKLNK